MTKARRQLQRQRRIGTVLLPVALVSVLVAAFVALGCGDPGLPSRPTPSEGLVFLRSTGDGGADVFRARLSDGSVQIVAETPDVIEERPLWMASALRVLTSERPAAATDLSTPPRLMLRDVETGRHGPATGTMSEREGQASVSADGKRILYIFRAPPNSLPQSGLKIVNPLTSIDQLLNAEPRGHSFLNPVFAPDGKTVAVQVRGRKRGDDLYVLVPKGFRGPVTDAQAFVDAVPRFARDGRSLFFSRSAFEPPRARKQKRAAAETSLGGGDICQVQLTGHEVTCIEASDDAREFGVDPSATRDELVFVRERWAPGETTGDTDVFLVDVSGENLRRITDDPARAERNPRWSPDGERIVFEAGSDAEPQIVVVDRRGRRVFETEGHAPAWAAPF